MLNSARPGVALVRVLALLGFAATLLAVRQGEAVKLWTATRANMTAPLSDYALAKHEGKGTIYLIGGCSEPFRTNSGCVAAVANVIEYSPNTDEYKSIGMLSVSRFRHSAGIVNNNLVVFAGMSEEPLAANVTEVFDLTSKTWTAYPGGPGEGLSDMTAFVLKGKLYAVGGYSLPDYTAQDRIYVYVGHGQWSLIGFGLGQARGDASSVVIGSKAYILGGWSHLNGFQNPLASFEVCDFARKSCVTTSSEFAALGDVPFCVVRDSVLILGGEPASTEPSQDIRLIPISKGTPQLEKSRVQEIKLARNRFRAQCVSIGSSVILFGGMSRYRSQCAGKDDEFEILRSAEEFKLM